MLFELRQVKPSFRWLLESRSTTLACPAPCTYLARSAWGRKQHLGMEKDGMPEVPQVLPWVRCTAPHSQEASATWRWDKAKPLGLHIRIIVQRIFGVRPHAGATFRSCNTIHICDRRTANWLWHLATLQGLRLRRPSARESCLPCLSDPTQHRCQSTPWPRQHAHELHGNVKVFAQVHLHSWCQLWPWPIFPAFQLWHLEYGDIPEFAPEIWIHHLKRLLQQIDRLLLDILTWRAGETSGRLRSEEPKVSWDSVSRSGVCSLVQTELKGFRDLKQHKSKQLPLKQEACQPLEIETKHDPEWYWKASLRTITAYQ